jgi:hypothetical protein
VLLLHLAAKKIVESCPYDGDGSKLADRVPAWSHGSGQNIGAELKFQSDSQEPRQCQAGIDEVSCRGGE